jgi:hypothetical protein
LVRRVYFIFMLFTVLGFAGLPATAQSGRTFYIDFASGSNSNPGTQAAPWKTHPYMQTSAACTGTGSAPSYSHQAGDQFIFKGGVSWPAACFSMKIQAGGSSTSPDYYGVDVTWFSGGAFIRPKFDLNFTVPAGNNVVGAYNINNLVFDNFEILHQSITGSCATSCGGSGGTPYPSQAAFEFIEGNANITSNVIVKNSYIHDWVTSQGTNCPDFLNYAAGAIYGASLVDNTEISGENSWYGPSQTPITFGGAIEQRPGQSGTEVRNSKIHGTMAALFSIRKSHDNEIYHVSSEHGALDSCPHSQVIENDDGGADIVYNNFIHDNQGRAGQNVGVVIYEGPYSQIYNNVMYHNNVSGYNGDIVLTEGNNGSQPGAVQNTYNNTVDCSNGVPCFATDSKGTIAGTVNLKNNVFVTNGSPISLVSGISTFGNASNHTMPTSEASTYGFTSARKYAPGSSDPNVVGKSVSVLSVATGALAALAFDAAGAPWFGASYVPRDATSDLGAFVFSAQSSSAKPNPPTNLSVIVQ